MSTFAVTMCKDEADVIAETVGWMIGQVDRVIVADNGSTDGTREILEGLDVELIDDHEPGYFQSAKMTGLAMRALAQGAEWVVPFDADEVWIAEGRIANALAELPNEAMICEATVLDHVAVEGEVLSPWRRPETLPLRKVACRARADLTIEQGNHGATYEFVRCPLRATDLLEIRHFPYRSAEQMIRKARNGAAAYAATDLPEDVGAHWRDYGKLTDEQLAEVFAEYFSSSDPLADGLVYDPLGS